MAMIHAKLRSEVTSIGVITITSHKEVSLAVDGCIEVGLSWDKLAVEQGIFQARCPSSRLQNPVLLVGH